MDHQFLTMAFKIKRKVASTLTAQIAPGLHPVLNRIYHNRGITSPSELDMSLEHLLKFDSLTGIETAVVLLEQAIEQNKSILIIGDFDADGATHCAGSTCPEKFWC